MRLNAVFLSKLENAPRESPKINPGRLMTRAVDSNSHWRVSKGKSTPKSVL